MTAQITEPGLQTHSNTPLPLQRRVFALADTHLGFAVGKTMDRFGDLWIGHAERIAENIRATVTNDDVLLLPGDLSWATKRFQAQPDLEFLADLPGIKVAIKGNHDFWWESDKPINFPGLLSPPVILDNGAIGIAGSRGWYVPVEETETFASDVRNFERERRRVQRSLDAIAHCEVRLAMTHYPPQPFMDLFMEAEVALVAYGHVHLGSFPEDEILAVNGDTVAGIPLYCVACDRIGFAPQRLL